MRMFDNGAIGAAVITVFTECVILAGSIYLRPAGVLDAAAWKSLLRCTLACLAMVPPVLVVGSAPLAVKVAVGVVTYVAASLVLRSVTIDEVRTGFTQGFRSAGRAA
jgi:hypothetical protein